MNDEAMRGERVAVQGGSFQVKVRARASWISTKVLGTRSYWYWLDWPQILFWMLQRQVMIRILVSTQGFW